MKSYSYDRKDVLTRLPVRSEDSHKGSCGKLLLIAGSVNMAGAAYLSALAAFRSGIGLVYLYTPEENRVILQQLIPEAVLCTYPAGKPDLQKLNELIAGKQAIAMGPGIGRSDAMKAVLELVLKQEKPVVLDADGLNVLAEDLSLFDEKKCDLVITPHPAEMSRLTGMKVADIVKEKDHVALSMAEKYQIITVLKDHHTAVSNGKEVYVNQTGNHGMATAGSGDVLTGVIGSLLAQGMDPFEAAKVGTFLHGLAGDQAGEIYGKRSLMARNIADYICRGID